jgi:hypothetical protein
VALRVVPTIIAIGNDRTSQTTMSVAIIGDPPSRVDLQSVGPPQAEGVYERPVVLVWSDATRLSVDFAPSARGDLLLTLASDSKATAPPQGKMKRFGLMRWTLLRCTLTWS